MESLDDLLEDLRATKQHVLQRDLPADEKITNTAKYWSLNSDNLPDTVRKSRNTLSMPCRPLQENLAKLDGIINDLDEIDGNLKEHEFSNTINHEANSEKCNQSAMLSHNKSRPTNNEPIDHMSQTTKEAAAHASLQLDELMISLEQIKFQQQTSPDTCNSCECIQCDLPANGTSVSAEVPADQTADLQIQNPTDNAPYPQKSANKNHTNGNVTSLQSTFPSSLCLQCNQPVIDKVITALGGVWHPDHFNCAHCGKNVVKEFFYEHEGAPCCSECHRSLFAPKCAFCGEAIVDRCLEAMGNFWHSDHFFCQRCHKLFVDNAMAHEHQGKVFCQNCYYSMFGETCAGCGKPIIDAYIAELDQLWHQECFKCKDCGLKLTGLKFYVESGQLYCERHHCRNSGKMCAACREPILGGRCINALGNRYHLQHFVCTYCLRPLSTGTFKERLNKPYCDPCFRQLFG